MADFHLLINLQNTEPISAGPFNQIDILYIDILVQLFFELQFTTHFQKLLHAGCNLNAQTISPFSRGSNCNVMILLSVVTPLARKNVLLYAHMHRKLKLVPSPTCPCGEEDQTTEHVLQKCNRHQPERIAQWPSATPIHQKLYGGLEDLKKTTNFITAAGLVVQANEKKKKKMYKNDNTFTT